MLKWREGQAAIAASCHALADTLLLAAKAKPIYGDGAFAQRQADHIAQVGTQTCMGGGYLMYQSLAPRPHPQGIHVEAMPVDKGLAPTGPKKKATAWGFWLQIHQ